MSREGNVIHVTLQKDVSARDEHGRAYPEGMHVSYFHVYLSSQYVVEKVVRGPDMIS